MGFKQPEAGQRSPIQYRVGIDFERFRGVNKEKDPGALSPDELQEAINIRLTPSGKIVCRGGQEPVFEDELDDCVTMIFDDEYNPNDRIYYDAPPSSSGRKIKAANVASGTVSTIVDDAGVAAADDSKRLFVVYKRELYTFGANTLVSVDVAGQKVTLRLTIGAVSDATTRINSAVVFDDGTGEKIWMCTSGGYVYSWDGSLLTLEASALGAATGATHGTFLIPYLGYLFFASTHLLLRRSTAGDWTTTIAMPGGTTEFQPYDLVVHRNILYLMGIETNGGSDRDPIILSTDGQTLSIARVLPTVGSGSIGSQEGCRAGVSFGGYLFYAWMDASVSSGNIYLGRYDARTNTWVDTHKNITGQFGPDGETVTRLQKAGGCIFLGGPSENDVKLIRSPLSNTAGTWATVDSDDRGSEYGNDIIVFNG